MEWDQLQDWKNYDWIIVGTKAPDYLLGKGFVDGITTRKLMMDLSVPRNVDPCLGRHKQITLLNIDQINRTLKIRKQKMMHTLLEAEEYVSEATLKHASLFAAKSQYLIQHNGVVA